MYGMYGMYGAYKILLVGNSGTGKTSIVNRYINGYFTEQTKATVSVDFYFDDIKIKNNEF